MRQQDKQLKEEKRLKRRLRRLTYRDIVFCSIFEVEVAEYLDTCNIKWERNIKQFPTFVDGGLHYYVPDFYLPEYDLYLEVKGRFFSTTKKRKMFQAIADNEMRWAIIMLDEWKQSKRILKEKIKRYECA